MHETRYTCNRPRAHRLTVSIETQTRPIRNDPNIGSAHLYAARWLELWLINSEELSEPWGLPLLAALAAGCTSMGTGSARRLQGQTL